MEDTARNMLILWFLIMWAWGLQWARAYDHTKMYWIISCFTLIFGFLHYESQKPPPQPSPSEPKESFEEILQQYDNTGLTTLAKTKIGRNDPCCCGSGKKFKNCCSDVRDYARRKLMHL